MMDAMDLTMRLPEELARAMGLFGAEGSRRATFLLLLEAYREGKLSFGKFAEFAGISQAELLERMTEHGTYLNYGPGEIEEDRAVASAAQARMGDGPAVGGIDAGPRAGHLAPPIGY